MSKRKHDPSQTTLPGIELDDQQKLEFAKKASKPAATKKKKKKAESNDPPNLNKPLKLTVPDFSDPNRPKTCLEVDFPIVPINELSKLEGNAGKPIYQMSKWWARRRSCVFRAMLIAAATQAPYVLKADGTPELDSGGQPIVDETLADRVVWDAYYANHQKAENFKHLKVLDCFMGGGTTLVEGSRLGFQVTGVDLNPVAWFVVKNELACTDPAEVKELFDKVEAEVKPVIQPFYTATCPRGHKGKWFELAGTDDPSDDKLMDDSFDPLTLEPDERKKYRYFGPEVIYTFWAKHGECLKPKCGHRTPIFTSPVIAEKKLGVKFIKLKCKSCKTAFDAELGDARMAPDAEHVVLETEAPYTVLSQPFAYELLDYANGKKDDKKARAQRLYDIVKEEPGLNCPSCGEFAGQFLRDVLNAHRQAPTAKALDKNHLKIEPSRNSKKEIFAYLLVDPEWLKGAAGTDSGGELGGFAEASVERTNAWYRKRIETLKLIEVRGRVVATVEDDEDPEPNEENQKFSLPESITLADGRTIRTSVGTVPANAHVTCGKCGNKQDIREATDKLGHGSPTSVYALQCYCPECDANKQIYDGRFFAPFNEGDRHRIESSQQAWELSKDEELKDFWPREEIPETYMTHYANFALPKQGFTHWWKMFSRRQLLGNALLFKNVAKIASNDVALQGYGAIQQYLRNQNMFCIWDVSRDCMAPLLSNPNFAPKNRVVENCVFPDLGRGNWTSTTAKVLDGLNWVQQPWEALPQKYRTKQKSRTEIEDPVVPGANVICSSSSELDELASESLDLVITDPPFGDNIFYSDLANFFHAWLRLPLKDIYPKQFNPPKTPNAQEALAPRRMKQDEANDYYRVRLTACWAESQRVLKPGGLMAFTFHHSEDSQWAIVLESLFDAGYLLVQTFPIASDEQKGKGGQFGAKGTEYDVIHVCRKRMEDPKPVSWPKMRQWVKEELKRLESVLGSTKSGEISDFDKRVVMRGKAIEFFSKHYGKVFTVVGDGERENLTLIKALQAINQLLNERTGDAATMPPIIDSPEGHEFLRLFGTGKKMTSDDLNKSQFGTAINKRDLMDHGWVREEGRKIQAVPIKERFDAARQRPRKEMRNEIDQAHFLIGGCLHGSEMNVQDELMKDTWMVRPTVANVVEWYSRNAGTADIRDAAKTAHDILIKTREKLKTQKQYIDQQTSFGWNEEDW